VRRGGHASTDATVWVERDFVAQHRCLAVMLVGEPRWAILIFLEADSRMDPGLIGDVAAR
jgi:hypothetical protein